MMELENLLDLVAEFGHIHLHPVFHTILINADDSPHAGQQST